MYKNTIFFELLYRENYVKKKHAVWLVDYNGEWADSGFQLQKSGRWNSPSASFRMLAFLYHSGLRFMCSSALTVLRSAWVYHGCRPAFLRRSSCTILNHSPRRGWSQASYPRVAQTQNAMLQLPFFFFLRSHAVILHSLCLPCPPILLYLVCLPCVSPSSLSLAWRQTCFMLCRVSVITVLPRGLVDPQHQRKNISRYMFTFIIVKSLWWCLTVMERENIQST